MASKKLILASASPRRKELLSKIADFSVIKSDFDEGGKTGSPEQYALHCASGKALEVFGKTHGDRVVLGADTVVYADGKILGKPTTAAEAEEMLKLICGREHRVITAVCIISEADRMDAFDETRVFIHPLTAGEIESYILSGSPMDKAGAYGIQDKLIQSKLQFVTGSYDNVVGLPTELLVKLLPQAGIKLLDR